MTAETPFVPPHSTVPRDWWVDAEGVGPILSPAEPVEARSKAPEAERTPISRLIPTGVPRPPEASNDSPSLARAEGEEIDLRAIARLLRRRLALIVLVTGLILVALVPTILSMERTYTAQLRLRIDRPEAAVLASPASNMSAPLDLATEIERLHAQSAALRVIEDLRLDELEEFNPAPREPGLIGRLAGGLRALVDGGAPEGTQPFLEWNPVLANFYDSLGIVRPGSADVIVISFRSRDPALAAQVPNHVVEVYLQQRSAQADSQMARARDWLTDRIEAQRDRVHDLDVAAAEFRIGNDLDSEGLGSEAATRILTLGARLGELDQDRRKLASVLTDLEQGNVTSAAIDDLAPPLLIELRRDREARQRELATLRQTYGENHEKVVSALAATEETEAMIRSEAEHLAEALRLRIASSDQEIERTRDALAEARSAEMERSAKDADFAVMMEDLERERAKLATLEEQLRTLEGEAALPVAEAEILSPATPPRIPDGRGRKFYLALVLIGALGCAATVACVLELLDRSLRSQQQIRAMPGATPAGLIPRVPMRRRARLPSRLRSEPNTAFADAFRWLALALRRASGGAMPRSVLVTSSLPGEGKTTIAVGLATTLAMAGYRVLLVDADLRQGRVHEHLGVGAEPGLKDFLCGQATLERVVGASESGLEFIGRGAHQNRGLPDLRRFSEILDYGRATDRIIIIDSAPVLATAETAELAGVAESTLLIARWGRTATQVAQLSLDRLVGHSRRQVAVAINMVVPQRHALYSFPDSDLFSRTLRRYRASGS